jgi:hypothetical protein
MGKKENNVYLNMYYVHVLICTMYLSAFHFFTVVLVRVGARGGAVG